MQKIFINKETDLVEQILEVLTEEELNDDYFESCYAVIDPENKINTYNMKYNKEKEIFEVVEGMKEREEVEIIPSKNDEAIEDLKKENESLKKEIEEIKNMINQAFIKE